MFGHRPIHGLESKPYLSRLMQGKEQANGNYSGNQITRRAVDRGQSGRSSSTQVPCPRIPDGHGAIGCLDLTDHDGRVDYSACLWRLGPGDMVGVCVRHTNAAVRRLLSEPVREAIRSPGIDVRLHGEGTWPSGRRHVGLVAYLVLHIHRRGGTHRILDLRRPSGVINGYPHNHPAGDLLLSFRRGVLACCVQGHQDLVATDACCSRRFRSRASWRWRA